jgi:hypothetical protein
VEGSGSLIFARGKHKIHFRQIVFMAKRTPLYARVGGTKFKIASGAKITSRRQGFGAQFRASNLRLTAKVASRLNKKLGLGRTLQAGQLMGSLSVNATPATVHLRVGDRLQLHVAPDFFAKLEDRFVSLNPIAPAELAPGPILSFPVGLESTYAPNGLSGIVKLNGSVELLQLGNAQIFWNEVWLEPALSALSIELDVEPSPPYGGREVQSPLLELPPGALVDSDPKVRKLSLSSQAVTLSARAAAGLNDAFAKGEAVFAPGEQIGTLSMIANSD